MADEPPKSAADHRNEEQLNALRVQLLNKVALFLDSDLQLVQGLAKLMDVVAQHAQKNPEALFAGTPNIDEVLRTLKNAMEEKTGEKRDDILGGGLFGDIGDFIESIGDFLKSEKPFFLDILRLLLCGCKGTGW